MFRPGMAPNLSSGCISYPKFIAIAGVFLALCSGRQTNPATRQGDGLQDSLRSLAALLLLKMQAQSCRDDHEILPGMPAGTATKCLFPSPCDPHPDCGGTCRQARLVFSYRRAVSSAWARWCLSILSPWGGGEVPATLASTVGHLLL